MPGALVPFYPAADRDVQPAAVPGGVACRCCPGGISRSSRARRYPSDMTGAEWAVCEPLLPAPAWLAGRGGRPASWCMRGIADAIPYLTPNRPARRGGAPRAPPPPPAGGAGVGGGRAGTRAPGAGPRHTPRRPGKPDNGLDPRPPLKAPPRRWVVERTLSWITRHRRTVRDYERLAAHHETYVYWAMIIVMTRRLARQRATAQPATT